MTKFVNAREAAEWIASGEAVLIDVREPDEFRTEHIASAASLPLGTLGAQFAGMPLRAGRKVIFQCQMGGRGENACRLASELTGDHAFYNLEGGIGGWKAAGLPVVASGGAAKSVPSIFRQVQMTVGTLVLLAVVAGFSGWNAGFAIAGLFGFMLAFAGFTGWCGLAKLLSRMPWNRAN